MEENHTNSELGSIEVQNTEPEIADNSVFKQDETLNSVSQETETVGQSEALDPSSELILGKFKSVNELVKAYESLQKQQGASSEELGNLRKQAQEFNSLNEAVEYVQTLQNGFQACIEKDSAKFNTSEYFQDSNFCEIYKEAFKALGENLDTDRLVNLLDAYVSSRIAANDKKRAAMSETEQVLESMTYDKNPKTSITPPKKSFDEMTPKEIDELLERLI